jgi:hypothetical protein
MSRTAVLRNLHGQLAEAANLDDGAEQLGKVAAVFRVLSNPDYGAILDRALSLRRPEARTPNVLLPQDARDSMGEATTLLADNPGSTFNSIFAPDDDEDNLRFLETSPPAPDVGWRKARTKLVKKGLRRDGLNTYTQTVEWGEVLQIAAVVEKDFPRNNTTCRQVWKKLPHLPLSRVTIGLGWIREVCHVPFENTEVQLVTAWGPLKEVSLRRVSPRVKAPVDEEDGESNLKAGRNPSRDYRWVAPDLAVGETQYRVDPDKEVLMHWRHTCRVWQDNVSFTDLFRVAEHLQELEATHQITGTYVASFLGLKDGHHSVRALMHWFRDCGWIVHRKLGTTDLPSSVRAALTKVPEVGRRYIGPSH